MAITKSTTSSITTFAKYNDVAAGNTVSGPAQFVIMSESNVCITSSDGFTWTQRTMSGASGTSWFGKKNGLYTNIKVDNNSMTHTSPDGITWTQNTQYPVGITNGFQVLYSPGFFDPGKGFFVGTSSPLNIWVDADHARTRQIGITNAYGRGAIQVGNIIVIAAERYTSTGQPTIIYSTDNGATWGTNNMGGSEASGCRKPAYKDGVFVVSGGSTGVWSSTNGSTWTSRNGSVTGRHIWLEGGKLFCGDISTSTLYTSEDGLTWTARTSGLSTPVRGVVFGNGLYVAYGNGQVSTSTDTITWTARTSNTTQQLAWGIYA